MTPQQRLEEIADILADGFLRLRRRPGHVPDAQHGGPPPLGLANATARSSSFVEVTADYNCQVKVYQSGCAIDWDDNLPTWNSPWGAPGGIDGNATLLGSVSVAAGVPGQITGAGVVAGLQNILDGGEQNFIICRTDIAYGSVAVSSRVVVEFDLNAPPN